MSDVVKVSISGVGLTLSQDAYIVVKSYLYKLEKCYATNSDGKEIISDIESRIVELILSQQSASDVVEKPVVQAIIDQLGLPEDELTATLEQSESMAEEMPLDKFPRRLYRNPEGAKFGGVCSGIATFFNTDVVWIRSIFFLPLIALVTFGFFDLDALDDFFGSMFGFTTLLYFVMWVIVPMARTARQKLEMNGQKITANSIHRSFAKDATQMTSAKSSKVANVVAELLSLVGRLLILCIKAVAVLFGVALSFAAIAILVVVISYLFNVENVADQMAPLCNSLPFGVMTSILLAVALIALLPIIAIVWFLVALIAGVKKMGKVVLLIFVALWFAALVYLGVVGLSNVDRIRVGVHKMVIENSFTDNSYDQNDELQQIAEPVITETVVVSDSVGQDSVKILNK